MTGNETGNEKDDCAVVERVEQMVVHWDIPLGYYWVVC